MKTVERILQLMETKSLVEFYALKEDIREHLLGKKPKETKKKNKKTIDGGDE